MAKLMVNRKAFTLIEVLISIALMGLILVPLFNVVEMMRNSNAQLLHSLEKSTQITKATKVLFLDIMSSDGNFTLKKDEMSRFCMEETTNSLYELPVAKVCWLVLKEKNTLVRAEGNAYKLPLNYEDKVEVDSIMTNIEMFDVYREKKKDKVLVVIKQKEKEPISFLVQGIWPPKPQGKFLRDAKGNIIYGADGIPRREGDGKGAVKRAINGKNKTNRNGTNSTGTRPSGSTQNGEKRDKNGNITSGTGGQSRNRRNSNNQGTSQEGEQPRVR
jgi:prepilin-type N-terminal cleavage/methylation domain-containing protein